MLHNEFLFVLFFTASLMVLSILFIIDSIKDAVKTGIIDTGFWLGGLFAMMAAIFLCHYRYPGGTIYQHPQEVLSGIAQQNPDLIKEVNPYDGNVTYDITNGVKIASTAKNVIYFDSSECQKITRIVEYSFYGVVSVLLILTIVHVIIQINRRRDEILFELKYQGCQIDDLKEKVEQYLARD